MIDVLLIDDDPYVCRAIAAVFGERGLVAPTVPIGRVYAEHIKAIGKRLVTALSERSQRKGAVTGITTTYTKLDELLGGYDDGDLILIAGRPSMGKTAKALNVIVGATESGVYGLVFSLEMSKDSLAERLLAREARVDGSRLRTGVLDIPSWKRVSEGMATLVTRPIWIDDCGSLTISELRARARRWRMTVCPAPRRCMVVVDYLQLVNADSRRRNGNRTEDVSEVSRGLKQMARDLNCPVIALSQLNRSLESRDDKRPKMSDLRESGALEQDADVIEFLYRDEVYNPNSEDKGIAEIIIAKQRKGPTGMVLLAWLPEFQRFENLAHSDRSPPPRQDDGHWSDQ